MEKHGQACCQSCAMPITEEYVSKNADGSINEIYCSFCFKDGEFTSNETMDEMIEHCLEYLDEFNKGSGQKLTKAEARKQMRQFFPTLKRWKKA